MSADEQLILYCCQPQPAPDHTRRIGELVGRKIAWDYILERVARHRLTAPVYNRLKRFSSPEVPAQVLRTLERRYLASVSRNLLLGQELVKLIALFRACSIFAIPFKGPALSLQLYGDLAFRESGDLDILIQEHDYTKAAKLLFSQGYRLRYLFQPALQRLLLRAHGIYFTRKDGKIAIDLQGGICRGNFTMLCDLKKFKMEAISLEGREVPAFSLDDLLLILCVHGSKHMWERLIWVCDITALLALHPNIAWPRVLHNAQRWGVMRMLWSGLSLAHRLLQAPVPQPVLHRARGDVAVSLLLERGYEQIFSKEVKEVRTHLLWERLEDKIFFWVGEILYRCAALLFLCFRGLRRWLLTFVPSRLSFTKK